MFDYNDFLKHLPAVGKVEHGEVEKLPVERANPRLGPYGVVFQSPYLSVIREPVLFPSLAQGTHVRVLQGLPSQDIYGVVILPLRARPNGEEPEIALVKQWRYPRQGWMAEIPRGGLGSHERNSSGAVRELREETGLPSPDILVHMDDLCTDSGLFVTVCRHYMAVYMDPEENTSSRRKGDSTEAISGITWVPLSEWREEAMKPPVPGRPVGGLDGITSASMGLAYMTGQLARMEVTWNRIFEGRAHESPRLAERVRELVEGGAQTLDVKIVCKDEEACAKVRAELPLLDLKTEGQQEGATLTAYDIPLLTVVWLSQHPAVAIIESAAP